MNKLIKWSLLFLLLVGKQVCFAEVGNNIDNKALQVPGSSSKQNMPIKIAYEDFKPVSVNNEEQLKLTVTVINTDPSQISLETLTAVKIFEQYPKQEAFDYTCDDSDEKVCHYHFIGKLGDTFNVMTSQSHIEVQYKDTNTGNRNVYKVRPWLPLVATSALEFNFSQGSQNITVRNIYPDNFKLLNIELKDETDELKTECQGIKSNANCTFVIPQPKNDKIPSRTLYYTWLNKR